jgi:hypothetical protein
MKKTIKDKKEPLGQLWVKAKTKQAIQIAAIKENLTTVDFIEKLIIDIPQVQAILKQIK